MKSARPKDAVQHSFVLRSEQLGRRVATGAAFTFLGIAIRTALTLASTAVLARLLSPTDFGYVAMATVVTEFTALLSNFGFSAVLVQRRVITRLQMDTVFWIGVAMGLLLTSIVYAISFFTEALFATPFVGELLRVLAISFVISSLISVHGVILVRLLRFRAVMWIQSAAFFVQAIAAIALASAGFGVWSLVIAPIVGVSARVALTFSVVPYRPRFRFNAAYVTSTWKTNTSYFGSGLLYYANMNVDLLLIGRFLGAESLGYYQSARSLSYEVRGRIAAPLQRVLFPAFSSLQNDPRALQRSVLRSGRLMASIILPIALGISATAQEIVPILYGEQWLPMIPLLAVLSVSAAMRGSTAIAGSIFNATNRVGKGLRQSAIATALLVGGILVSFPYGVEAVTWAIGVASLYALVTLRVALAYIGLATRHVWAVIGPPAVSCAAMWFTVALLRSLDPAWLSNLMIRLVGLAATGAFVYVATLAIVSRTHLGDFISLAKTLRNR